MNGNQTLPHHKRAPTNTYPGAVLELGDHDEDAAADGLHAEAAAHQARKGVLDLVAHVDVGAAADEDALARPELPRDGARVERAAADADARAACCVIDRLI